MELSPSLNSRADNSSLTPNPLMPSILVSAGIAAKKGI